MSEKFQLKIGNKDLTMEVGRFARQADGAVTVQMGGTVVLVTCVFSKEAKENASFFPLTVEYQEKTYAAGKIPGGFFKREGRPSEKEILTARLIDRPIRPLFPEGFLSDVQVMALVISSDGENDSDMLAMNGASAAVSMSGAPFKGPIGTVRVGRVDGKFVLNPTFQELDKSDLDLVVAGTKDGVVMMESASKEVSEEIILEAVDFAYKNLKGMISLIEQIVRKCGREKVVPDLVKVDPALHDKVREFALGRLNEINNLNTKDQREEALDLLSGELIEKLVTEESGIKEADVKNALIDIEKETVRKLILEQRRRVDNRSFTQLRPISCEAGLLPRTHGSGLFTRGQTQSLAVTTLGTSADEQMIDALEGEAFKTFMLHYNFPPFSVGEVKPVRGPGRREIGHGALAERALKAVIPSTEEFPYTLRVVSDILESNGSSSMATVCAATLSLMDAGVPIKAPVGGVAIGLVKKGDKEVLLTDIAGVEDHFGDMDFKVAGTRKGITAIQMDLKIGGISLDLVAKALKQSKDSRLEILEKMNQAISKPKESLSEYAPRIITLRIKQDKIKDVIGPGGKIIRKIIADTGATIDIEDDGTVQIASTDKEALEKAVETVKRITEDVEPGKLYMGKIKRIMDFGAFCEVLPGKEGLIRISELADKFVKKVEDEVKVGQEVLVKVIEVDSQGRVNLSIKQAKNPESSEKKERRG